MKKKFQNKSLLIIGIVLVVIVGVGFTVLQVGKAQVAKSKVTELTELANAVGGDKEAFMAGLDYLGNQIGEMFGSGNANRLDYGYWDTSDGYYVDGTEIIDNSGGYSGSSTTTLNEVELGPRFSADLTFTAGATTTPGGLFSIQNTGDVKLCSKVLSYFGTDTGDDTLALTFSVSTSTSASAWSHTAGTIIASTTVATTTGSVTPNDVARIYSNQTNPGTFYAYSADSGKTTTTDFIWDNGVYILGAFDYTNFVSASTSAYTSRTGTVNIFCISK